MNFTKDDTNSIKGIAIILRFYHHLFAFPDRINDSYVVYPLFTYRGFDSSYILGVFGKLCVAIFLFISGFGLYLSIKKL